MKSFFALLLSFFLLNFGLIFAKESAKVKPPQDVILATASMQTVPITISSVGKVVAQKQVPLSFDVDGRLGSVLVNNGQVVKKQQLIATLDDKSDQAQLASLQANYQLQNDTYQRQLQLSKVGGVSAQALQQAHYNVVDAKAQVDQQQQVIKQKKLYAPFAGVVTLISTQVGAYFPKGTALTDLVQQSPLAIEYNLPAQKKDQVEIGQEVKVQSPYISNQTFTGTVNYVAPKIESNNGTFTLQASVKNKDFILLPGMFVSVKQVIDPNNKALLIPEIAVMTDIDGQYVFMYQAKNKTVQKQYIEQGDIIKDQAEVNSGLQKGDQVVVAGNQQLEDGQSVHVITGK